MYNLEPVRLAMQIYATLKENKGEFKRKSDPSLYSHYKDDNVREVLSLLQNVEKVRIFQSDESLYLIPELENEMYRYTNEELREAMNLKGNPELFTIQFIWMVVLSKFFNDQYEQTRVVRAYLPIDEVRAFVDDFVGKLKIQQRERIDELSHEYQTSLDNIVTVWDGLGKISEETKSVARSTTKDYGFILKALRFWEDQGILMVRNHEEIILMDRGRLIPEFYYHQEDTIQKIHQLMNELEGTEERSLA